MKKKAEQTKSKNTETHYKNWVDFYNKFGGNFMQPYATDVRRKPVFLLAIILCMPLGCRSGRTSLILQHPQTLAVGRMRITVPGPGAEVRFDSAEINGVQLKWSPLNPSQSLAATWTPELAELSSDGDLDKLVEDSKTRKYVVSHVAGGSAFYSVTLWQREGAAILKAQAYAKLTTLPMTKHDVEEVLSKFHLTDPEQQLLGSFAFGGGVVQMPPNLIERINAHVKVPFDKGQPDQWFDISTFTVDQGTPDDVIERHRRLIIPLLAHGMILHTLRTGARTVAGMSGHEAIVWSKSDHPGVYSFSAEFAFGGKANSPKEPNTSIIFSSTDFPDSIEPERLRSLWDAVLDSIRVDSSH